MYSPELIGADFGKMEVVFCTIGVERITGSFRISQRVSSCCCVQARSVSK